MNKIKNPILPGCNPDPSICRCGDDYYLATSTFEWFPGIPVYHSKDLKNWKLITHVLQDEKISDLRRLPSAKGIWAPCLSWCEQDGLFYVVYTIVNSMNAGMFDLDNYVITSPSIYGPWSEPVYLHSAGFDPSMFHDDDGRKWLVSLEWESRKGYYSPGYICIVEYNPKEKEIIGTPKRIWKGGTERGWVEGPHIYKRNNQYYLMCAEGGTWYAHCVSMGRSECVEGPYEKDPKNPILTSTLDMKYNPNLVLQKAGHGCLVETPLGESYLVHHCGRPFTPELRCTLGRETCIQKMYWTEDGWLRLEGEDNLAKEYVEESKLPEHKWEKTSTYDEFNTNKLGLDFYSLRNDYRTFIDLTTRESFLRIRGQESLCSLNRVSLVARKLTSIKGKITTKMDFEPEKYQHSAGLVLYYDNMDYVFLRKYYSETLNSPAIALVRVDNGKREELCETRVALEKNQSIYMRLNIVGRRTYFEWSLDGVNYSKIGGDFDTSEVSDEFCKSGEFTGTFVGMCCIDGLLHKKYADFDFFDYDVDENYAIN